ncbi:MAG: PAS domain-containing protein [Rhodospirillales bacterium]|nr:PAS domain-containing protein [Rhodospirillales bacterium]
MRAFGAQWAAARDGHAMPSRAAFRAEDWGRWWSGMLLYRIEADGVFRMTYQGDEVENTDGGPKIGRRLEEIAPPALVARTLETYGRVAKEGLPIYSIRIGAWRKTRHIAFERLLLPLGPPDGPADHVMGLLLDHGLDDNIKRSDLFAQSPTLDSQSFVLRQIDPDSFAGCDLESVGKGIGLPIPG